MAGLYDFYYTYYSAKGPNSLDAAPEFLAIRGSEHQFEADLTYADGRTETVRLPEPGLFPTPRPSEKEPRKNAAPTIGQQSAAIASSRPALLSTCCLRPGRLPTFACALDAPDDDHGPLNGFPRFVTPTTLDTAR